MQNITFLVYCYRVCSLVEEVPTNCSAETKNNSNTHNSKACTCHYWIMCAWVLFYCRCVCTCRDPLNQPAKSCKITYNIMSRLRTRHWPHFYCNDERTRL